MDEKEEKLKSPLLSEEEAANYLRGVKPKTLQTWRSSGTGPSYVKIGREAFYTVDMLDEFIAKQVKTAI